jgi:hypothetical protein
MLDVILKRFEQPDDLRQFEKGKFELVHITDMTICTTRLVRYPILVTASVPGYERATQKETLRDVA